MIRLTYHIELQESALLTGLEGDPNSSVTLPFLAGSVLRGALIGQYLRQEKLSDLGLDNNPVARRLFFDGQTRYLNGYLMQPWESEWLSSLPTPRSWHQPKNAAKSSPIYDFAVRETPLKQPKGFKKTFVIAPESAPHLLSPQKQIRIQTSRDRDYGRATIENGAVYRYESLQKGQTFVAHILCDHEEDADILRPFLDQTMHIGGVRSSDYGCVQLRFVEKDEEDETWSETDTIRFGTGNLPDTTAIVTLLSDALLRNETGQFSSDPQAMAKALGIQVEPVDVRYYIGQREIGGFNRKWGLPLPQAVAFQMGSVFAYHNLSQDTVARLRQMRAVGEQQVDGYGRIAVNWHTQSKLKPFPAPDDLKAYTPKPKPINDEAAESLAQQMVQRRLKQKLDRKLLEKVDYVVGNRANNRTRSLSKSQLYRLRQSVHASLQTVLVDSSQIANERKALKRILDDIYKRKSAQRQFDKSRIDGEPMLRWMRNVIDNDNFVFAVNSDDYPQLGSNVQAKADVPLIYEYNLRYLDAVLGRIAKEKREDN